MDADAAMAAAVDQPRPPPRRAAGSRRGFFAFLKDGVLVTTRNRALFLPLAALHATRSLALLAARIVALRYLGPTLGLKANDDDDDDVFSALLNELLAGRWWLLPATAACNVAYLANMVLGLAIEVAMVCAAVASCSAASIEGGPGRTTLTLASLLGEVMRNLSGYMATAVFVQAVELGSAVACMLVLAVLAAADAYLGVDLIAELVYFLLHLIGPPLVLIYHAAARKVAVVVSVAEPGLRAGGALRRARRLTRGRKKLAQATLHALLSWALNKAVWKMYDVTMARVPHSIAAAAAAAAALFWLGGVVVYMLVGAVEVLYMATVTAYYFDCKRTEEEKAGHIHME